MTLVEIKQGIEKLKISNDLLHNQISTLKNFEQEASLLLVKNVNEKEENQSIVLEIKLLLAKIHKILTNFNEAIVLLNEVIEFPEILNKQYKASAFNILGNVYSDQNEYLKALQSYFQSITEYEILLDEKNLAGVYTNISNVLAKLGDFHQSLEYGFLSLSLFEKLENKKGISFSLNIICINYRHLNLFDKALEYALKDLEINEIYHPEAIAYSHTNLGVIYSLIKANEKAIYHMLTAYEIFESLDNVQELGNSCLNIGTFYSERNEIENALSFLNKALTIHTENKNEFGIAVSYQNLGKLFLNKLSTDLDKSYEYLTKAKVAFEKILHKEGQMICHKSLSEYFLLKSDFENAYLHIDLHYKIKDEINSEETKKKATQFDQQRIIEEDRKARQLKLARFQEQEKLLHNILPINIADRILKQETFIADHFESVSVLFMDLVGFTKLSSIAPPKQLVYLLDTIFTKADEIVESFGLEKIKTIGDGYLAVANVTSSLEHHQIATAKASLELLEGMKKLVITFPEELGNSDWTNNMNELQIRIGIHSGEVVAGIIGKNKFTFDLWGDAVNVASRMESHSEPWKIHISEEFAMSIEKNPEFNLIPRGEISIKGKGTMNTFWLEKAE
jgi:adenylate cyclase